MSQGRRVLSDDQLIDISRYEREIAECDEVVLEMIESGVEVVMMRRRECSRCKARRFGGQPWID
jgi:hypothetical protein